MNGCSSSGGGRKNIGAAKKTGTKGDREDRYPTPGLKRASESKESHGLDQLLGRFKGGKGKKN